MKRITLLAFCIIISGALYAQFPSLGKAKGLLGKKSSSSSNNDQTNQSSSNNSNSTPPSNNASGTQSIPNTNSSQTGNTQKPGKPTPSTIYFSSTSYASANQASGTNTFKDGDMIYARVNFPAAIKTIGGDTYKYGTTLLIKCDGQYFNAQSLETKNDSLFENSYYEFQLIGSSSAAKFYLVKYITQAFANSMTTGKHNFDVTITRSDDNGNKMVIAEGTTVLDYSDGKKKLQAFASSFTPKQELTKADKMPPAAMHNAAIEKDLMNYISNDFEEPITPLRAVIDDNDWSIERDDYNVILRRVIGGYVAFKVPRTGLCYYKKIRIYQPYSGGGTYGKSQYYESHASADLIAIDCANVMK